MFLLLKLMLREEYRMHVSYSSRTIFAAIPLFVGAVSFLIGVTLDRLQESVPLAELLTLANMGIFIYGLSVGAFGFLGRTYVERRYGRVNYLVAMPTLLPLSFRRAFLAMFMRDILFYLALILLPAMVGLLLSAPLAGFSLLSVMSVFVPILLSFLYGISLSFAVSVLFTRSLFAFLAAAGGFIMALLGHGLFDLYGLDVILPSFGLQFALPPFEPSWSEALGYTGLSLIVTLLMVIVAAAFVKESYEGARTRFKELLPSYLSRCSFVGGYQPLLAKEIVDLIRSGTISKMIFSFIAPLFFISLTTWYVNNGLRIPVGFNTVFYAAMVGFFGVLLYSWLTNVDLMDYYETLPVTVPQLIRTKLIVYFLLMMSISTAFVVAIGLINGEARSLWLALPVLYIMSAYTVMATAYLTGISPSSFLFNPEILVKFSIVSILPDLCLTILSFSLDSTPFLAGTGIGLVCGVLLLCTWLFFRGIESKWSASAFS